MQLIPQYERTLQIQRIAAQRNVNLRLQFRAEISVLSAEQLIFLDETGIVCIYMCNNHIRVNASCISLYIHAYFTVLFCLG